MLYTDEVRSGETGVGGGGGCWVKGGRLQCAGCTHPGKEGRAFQLSFARREPAAKGGLTL